MTLITLSFLASFAIVFLLSCLLIRKFAPSVHKENPESELYRQAIEARNDAAWRRNRQMVMR
jgi:hypothetical protein